MPLLAQCYQTIGRALNDLVAYTASSGTSSSVTIAALVNADPVASKQLENGAWFFNENTTYQARGRPGGFTPSSGTQVVDPPWAQPTLGDTIYMTRLCPISEVLTRETSYRTICNETARWLWFEHQLLLTTVAGAHTYSLATYGRWLTQQEQFRGLLDPPIVTDFPPQDGSWRRPRLDFASGSPTLYLPSAYATSGETFRLNVKCPLIENINGVDSTATMILPADSINGTLAEIETVGLWIAYRTLATGQGPEAATWARMAADQEARARRLAHWFDRESAPPPSAAAGPAAVAA